MHLWQLLVVMLKQAEVKTAVLVARDPLSLCSWWCR
jgi:hypothetical protein